MNPTSSCKSATPAPGVRATLPDALLAPPFLPGIEVFQTSGVAECILSYFNYTELAGTARVSKGFHRAIRYSMVVRIDPKQGDIQKALQKYLLVDQNGFTQNPRVTELDFSYCTQLADEDLAFVAQYFPALKVLKLGECARLTNVCPIKKFVKLQYLDLAGCAGLRDVLPLAECINLQHLILVRCTGLREVLPLAECINLQHLILVWCTGLRDVSPLQKLVNLQFLDLSFCPGLRDVSPLAECINLQRLDLCNCRSLMDVLPLAQCINLRELDVKNCGGARMTSEELSSFSPEVHIHGYTVCDEFYDVPDF